MWNIENVYEFNMLVIFKIWMVVNYVIFKLSINENYLKLLRNSFNFYNLLVVEGLLMKEMLEKV